MKTTIKVPLSIKGIEELSKKLKTMKKDISEVDDRIVDKLATFAQEEINKNLAATPYKEGSEDTEVYIDKKGKGKASVGMRGTQVIYMEFGTGTEGENNIHPDRLGKGLDWYNSGVTIRENIGRDLTATNTGKPIPDGGLYWTYIDKNGDKIYTQGIPAGKQVFDAAQELKKKKKEIIKKEVGDILSKL